MPYPCPIHALVAGMEQSYRSNMRSLSVDYSHGGKPAGFDVASADVRAWLQQWPRVLSQLETLVVGLKRRCASRRCFFQFFFVS